MSEPVFSNRLIHEKSPYLLQHAHNPVDWYAWGKEAFDAAKNKDKPIFLSIGYATCHWCHVMEKESFENREIATLLNDAFINIKLDREELPQIDAMYMDFAPVLTSYAAGWPLNVILTPDLKPLFAVTYLPPRERRGLLGLDEFIKNIETIWKSEERLELIEQSEKILEIFQQTGKSAGIELPTEGTLAKSAEVLFELIDPLHGGIKGAPKFPLGYQAEFLLFIAQKKQESRALFCVELTLDMMQRGGIYDHLGGGFARYAVDEQWQIPHFEKMLYDNALLANTYIQLWKYTKKENWKAICFDILRYVQRELTDPQGGFYCGEDADSEGHEGLFYTWTAKEIHQTLPPEEASLFCEFYGVREEGNFEGRNVLHISTPLEEFAEEKGMAPGEIASKLQKSSQVLFELRAKRPRPLKDDKILSGWNGLMIHAFAEAGAAFNQPKWIEEATKAAQRIKAQLWKEKRLLRRYRDGDARYAAGLDEYAFLIKGVLTLFQRGCGTEYLAWAIEMADILEREFKAESGAFFTTNQADTILFRRCEFYDGAEPSGNGVHCENLLRLFQITQVESYLAQAEDILKAAKEHIETFAPGACYLLIALSRYFNPKAPTIVVALDEAKTLEEEIGMALARQFCPHAEVIWRKKEDALLPKLLPLLNDKIPVGGKTTVYICRQDGCESPLTNKEEILKRIEGL